MAAAVLDNAGQAGFDPEAAASVGLESGLLARRKQARSELEAASPAAEREKRGPNNTVAAAVGKAELTGSEAGAAARQHLENTDLAVDLDYTGEARSDPGVAPAAEWVEERNLRSTETAAPEMPP